MQIITLNFENYRGYEEASFRFLPGVNLIAGPNGAGKTSLLDALRGIIASVHREVGYDKARYNLGARSIRELPGKPSGIDSMRISATGNFSKNDFSYYLSVNRKDGIGVVRGEVYSRFDRDESLNVGGEIVSILEASEKPLGIYYSAHRSVLKRGVYKEELATGENAAYVRAFSDRGLDSQEMAFWWLAHREQYGDALKIASKSILKNCEDIEPEQTGARIASLRIKKGKQWFWLSQLSDGERSLLSIGLDLARRLALLNSDSGSNILERKALVLIDEIELHLHPKWQRQVIKDLPKSFPSCQFIITTHSPQIISEVESDRVCILDDGQVRHPDQTLGMDSAWILRHVMDANDRPRSARQTLTRIQNLLDEREAEEALKIIRSMEQRLGHFDDLQSLRTLAELILRFEK